MTEKDYIAIARAIRIRTDQLHDIIATQEGILRQGWHQRLIEVEITTTHIADALQQDNPLFNRSRFFAACGLETK
jgi:hypothetical protein